LVDLTGGSTGRLILERVGEDAYDGAIRNGRQEFFRRPFIEVLSANDLTQVIFSGGVLEAGESLFEAFTEVKEAVSPYRPDRTGAMRFFRVRVKE